MLQDVCLDSLPESSAAVGVIAMDANEITSEPVVGAVQPQDHVPGRNSALRMSLGYLLGLTLLFAPGTGLLLQQALESKLHSHIVLVPFISAYLLYVNRRSLPLRTQRSFGWACVSGTLGIAFLILYFVWGKAVLGKSDALGLGVAAYLCLLNAGLLAILGLNWVKAAAFPLFFLWFMAPLPDRMTDTMEKMLVAGSAAVSEKFFIWADVPVFRTGEILQIPGIVLEVARECSGIRSTWVLFITSLVAAYLFLRSPWARLLLVAVVIPLGILRNALRILVIGWLCVHQGPHMIDSRIHHEGGPVFFAISLLPLFLLAWLLRRRECSSTWEKKGSDFSRRNH